MKKLQLNQKTYSMVFDTTGPENDGIIADALNVPVETIGSVTYNTSKTSDGCYCYFVSTVNSK